MVRLLVLIYLGRGRSENSENFIIFLDHCGKIVVRISIFERGTVEAGTNSIVYMNLYLT